MHIQTRMTAYLLRNPTIKDDLRYQMLELRMFIVEKNFLENENFWRDSSRPRLVNIPSWNCHTWTQQVGFGF